MSSSLLHDICSVIQRDLELVINDAEPIHRGYLNDK